MAFPLFSPEREGRSEILAIQARQQGIGLTSQAHALLAAETERYSGADLQAVIAEARFLSTLGGLNTIDVAQARAALDNVRPVTLASMEGYARSAIEACTNLRYLPDKIAEAERARLTQVRRSSALDPAPQAGVRGARQL
jgi:SpoVK/Ycf46/Vps4 family AAA+-type ATPase